MSELIGFPMISQRDGDANADFDCVPTSIAAALTWLTGKSYSGGEIKDAVLGAGYVGGTGATQFVDYCAENGVRLVAVNGTGPELVNAIKSAIDAGHPALITEPDPYLPGWTHVCCAFKYNGSTITVMDPWIDQPVSKSFSDWSVQLQDNQIWTLEKAMQIPSGWHDDGATLTAPNGHKVVFGFRDFVLNFAGGWNPADQPQSEEFHADPLELSNLALGAGQKQCFNRTVLEWTPKQGVFEAWPGQEVYALLQRLNNQPAPTTGQTLTDAEKAGLDALRELKSALAGL